jgi:hypothetical protein
MKVWLTPNQVLEQRESVGAEPGVPIAHRRIGALETASPQDVHRAVRWAVRAYARDPSARNGLEVELAIAALRRQRMPRGDREAELDHSATKIRLRPDVRPRFDRCRQ